MALSEGLLLALVSMFSWGVADFIVVYPLRKMGNIKTLLIGSAVGFLAFIIYMPISGADFSLTGNALIVSMVSGFFLVAGFLMFNRAMQKGKVSIVNPISLSWAATAILVGFILFKQTPTTLQLMGAFLIISGIFFLTQRGGGKSKNLSLAGVPEAFACMIMWGLSMSIRKFAIDDVGWLSASGAIWFWQLFFTAVAFGMRRHNISWPNNTLAGIAGLVGFLNMFGGVTYNVGIAAENLSVISSVSTASPLITVLLAFLILKERLFKIQYLGVASVILGILIIAL